MNDEKVILVTGAAGFIGAFLCAELLKSQSIRLIGVDNLNDYYDVELKQSRLAMVEALDENGAFVFMKGDISDPGFVDGLFADYKPNIVINLAAQAGVRYSIDNPQAYIDSNVIGFFNILEACRKNPVEHLIYASSSSVYGSNEKVPYSVDDPVDNPVSLYAATKKTNELMAHAYSKLYDIPSTGLRFFTVYGPMGRPDMAYFKFADLIMQGKPIEIYNHGDMKRDFTYIDDIVQGISALIDKIPIATKDGVRYKVYNIGNSSPEPLLRFVDLLENAMQAEGLIDERPEHRLLPMQPGDVYQTFADTSDLESAIGFRPSTSLEDGLGRFVKWYKSYIESQEALE